MEKDSIREDHTLMLYDAIADNMLKLQEQVQRLDKYQKNILSVNAKVCATTTQFNQIFRNLSILNRTPTQS